MRLLDIVRGRRKGQLQSFAQKFRRSTDVIEMAVGEDHIGNFFRVDMVLGQGTLKSEASMIMP